MRKNTICNVNSTDRNIDTFLSFPRCAYITFASKDSVDKAMALSGTIFLSRIVKVYTNGFVILVEDQETD